MKDLIKFFSCVILYIVIAFGIYGYLNANKTFKDGGGGNFLVAILWPVAIPLWGICEVAYIGGNFSTSLFTPVNAERVNHE